MKTHKLGLVLGASVLMLAGCATPYIPPTSGPTAIIVGGIDDWFAIKGEDGCGQARQFKDKPTKIIPANTEMLVMTHMTFGNKICNVKGSFPAREGYRYSLFSRWSHTGRGGCTLAVLESLYDDAGKLVDKEFIELKEAHTNWWAETTICAGKKKSII